MTNSASYLRLWICGMRATTKRQTFQLRVRLQLTSQYKVAYLDIYPYSFTIASVLRTNPLPNWAITKNSWKCPQYHILLSVSENTMSCKTNSFIRIYKRNGNVRKKHTDNEWNFGSFSRSQNLTVKNISQLVSVSSSDSQNYEHWTLISIVKFHQRTFSRFSVGSLTFSGITFCLVVTIAQDGYSRYFSHFAMQNCDYTCKWWWFRHRRRGCKRATTETTRRRGRCATS